MSTNAVTTASAVDAATGETAAAAPAADRTIRF
jgi:hypothetical protein